MLDLNRLYSNGCDSFIIDQVYLKRLQKLISNEEWVQLEQSKNNTIKSAPKWILDNTSQLLDNQQNISFKEGDPSNCSEFTSYKRIFELMLSENKYNGYLDTHYDLKVNTIQIWDGVEEHPDFHWDGKVNGDLFWLIYLSDHDLWDENLGGGIQCGKRVLTSDDNWELNNLKEEQVFDIETFWPDNGRIVICNNLNPTQIHKPLSLSDHAKSLDTKRVTMLVSIKSIPKKQY